MSEETNEPQANAEPHIPTRWGWVAIASVIMGGIAVGSVIGLQKINLVSLVGGDPELAFWAFQLGTGVGYLVGGFIVALASPGETIREPIIGAVVAFVVQNIYLLVEGVVTMGPKMFIAMAAIDGCAAYGGAWAGEFLSGALSKKSESA